MDCRRTACCRITTSRGGVCSCSCGSQSESALSSWRSCCTWALTGTDVVRTARGIALALAPISLLALVLAALALQDIYHGETDLWLEWTVVRTAFAIVAVFHALALRALRSG